MYNIPKWRLNYLFVLFGVIFSCLASAEEAAHPVAAPSSLPVVPPVIGCAALANTDLADVGGAGSRITHATEANQAGVGVCVVEGVLSPSIEFRVSLPTRTWSQRLLQIGCGGLCGHIPEEAGGADGCAPLDQGGFVQAATDMGHQGQSGDFGQDTQQRSDFAYRAVHLTALASKKLIRAYYGQNAKYAYFTGCSDGGREALMEAQRYPDDFDGILAGAPALNFQVQNSLYHGWQAASNTGADGRAILTAARLPLLHQAVLEQCDALDGLKDGLIADPRACHFDPASIQCQPGQSDTSHCLTPQEVATVRKLYDGPHDPSTGERLTVGGPMPGSELAWAGVFVPAAANQPIFSQKIMLDAVRNLTFEKNPPANFSLADLKFTKATFEQLVPLHALYDATNPDLRKFAQAGHKLILWHGWADQHISPLNTIAYHEAVMKFMGSPATGAFERLYLIPGMYHCSGGDGPSSIDLLTPLMAWVEHSATPDTIMVKQAVPNLQSHFGQPAGDLPPLPAGMPPLAENGKNMPPMPMGGPMQPSSPVKMRPVFPYPYLAHKVSGNGLDADSQYTAGEPLYSKGTQAWVGSSFFTPYVFKQ